MPPAPESGKVGGKERRFEVFRQVQPQEQAHGPGNLGIAGKVEIQLQGIGHGAQNQHGAAVGLVVGEYFIHQYPQHVAHGHQLEQAQGHQPQAPHGAGGVKAVFLFQLGQKRAAPADGALGDGGKKVQEQRTVDEVGLHLTVAPGGIDQVGDGRKAVKTDAQRHGHGLPARQPGKGAVVLEKGKDEEKPHDSHPQNGGFVGAGQGPAAKIGKYRNGNGHRQHGRHGQRIEYPAGTQQKGALPPLRQMQVHRSHHQ